MERNKNNSQIIIDGKKDELKEYKTLLFSFLRKKININKLEIKLKEMINVPNMSSKFNGCELLSSLPDISKWNANNIEDINHKFGGCSSLSYLPDISNWNSSNATNLSFMFSGCESLSSIPDIEKEILIMLLI